MESSESFSSLNNFISTPVNINEFNNVKNALVNIHEEITLGKLELKLRIIEKITSVLQTSIIQFDKDQITENKSFLEKEITIIDTQITSLKRDQEKGVSETGRSAYWGLKLTKEQFERNVQAVEKLNSMRDMAKETVALLTISDLYINQLQSGVSFHVNNQVKKLTEQFEHEKIMGMAPNNDESSNIIIKENKGNSSPSNSPPGSPARNDNNNSPPPPPPGNIPPPPPPPIPGAQMVAAKVMFKFENEPEEPNPNFAKSVLINENNFVSNKNTILNFTNEMKLLVDNIQIKVDESNYLTGAISEDSVKLNWLNKSIDNMTNTLTFLEKNKGAAEVKIENIPKKSKSEEVIFYSQERHNQLNEERSALGLKPIPVTFLKENLQESIEDSLAKKMKEKEGVESRLLKNKEKLEILQKETSGNIPFNDYAKKVTEKRNRLEFWLRQLKNNYIENKKVGEISNSGSNDNMVENVNENLAQIEKLKKLEDFYARNPSMLAYDSLTQMVTLPTRSMNVGVAYSEFVEALVAPKVYSNNNIIE